MTLQSYQTQTIETQPDELKDPRDLELKQAYERITFLEQALQKIRETSISLPSETLSQIQA